MYILKRINYRNIPESARVSIVIFICSIIRKAISFLIVPIYTRMAPSEQYGVYSLFQSWEAIFLIFTTLKMWNYLINNGLIKYENDRDRFMSVLSGLNISITLFFFVLYIIFQQHIYKVVGLSNEVMLILFLELVFYPTYEYWCSRKKFESDVKWYAWSSIAISIIIPVISILLVGFLKDNYIEYTGIGLIIGKVSGPLIIYIFIFLVVLARGGKLFDKEIWVYALKFSVPLLPHFMASVVLQQSDRIMIGKMCGESEAGIYSVAYSIGMVMIFVNDALNSAVIPWTYRMLKKKDYSKIPQVSTGCLALIAFVNILISLFAPELIAIMGPEEYRMAVYVIPPVAISNVFILLFNFYANIEYFYEETKLVAVASCISAILNIVLNYIFIEIYGYVAAGYTTVLCYILYALCHYLLMKYVMRKYRIEKNVYNNMWLWTIASMTILISCGTIFLYSYFWIRISIVLFFFVILALCWKKIYGFISKFLRL